MRLRFVILVLIQIAIDALQTDKIVLSVQFTMFYKEKLANRNVT